MPDGCTDILIAPARRSIRVVGVMSRALIVADDVPELLGIRLQPWAARAFLGVSADQLRDREVALGDVNSMLASAFLRIDSLPTMIETLGGSVWRRWLSNVPDDRVTRVTGAICVSSALCVKELARSVSLSERQLHRLFVSHVGLGPKTFARVMRLQDAVQGVQSGARLSDVALAAGYADQAHFCRDIRALTGLPARDVFKGRPAL